MSLYEARRRRAVIDAMSWLQLVHCLNPCASGWAKAIPRFKPGMTFQDVWLVHNNPSDLLWVVCEVLEDTAPLWAGIDAVRVRGRKWMDLGELSAARTLRGVVAELELPLDHLLIENVQKRLNVGPEWREILSNLENGVDVYVSNGVEPTLPSTAIVLYRRPGYGRRVL